MVDLEQDKVEIAPSEQRRKRKRHCVLGVIAVSLIGLAGVMANTYLFGGRFSNDEIRRYEQAVADLDSEIEFYKVVDSQKANEYLMAFAINGKPSKPLEVWKQLKPLLERRHPSPVDFQEAQKHITNLAIMAGMFSPKQFGRNEPILEKAFQAEVDDPLNELRTKVSDWKHELDRKALGL